MSSDEIRLAQLLKEIPPLCRIATNEYNKDNSSLALFNASRNRKLSRGPRSLRRGVLMSLLQENSKAIPLWVGDVNNPAPPLCGSIGVDSAIEAKPGDHVAALVPEPDFSSDSSSFAESWILAEVVSYNSDKKTFQVEDVDAEEGKIQYVLPESKMILLPKFKAHPLINPEAIFPPNSLVLALYPQTTCFYRAIVDSSPENVHDDYSLFFEDSSYPDGYAPAIKIPQLYVIHCPEYSTDEIVPNSISRRR